MSGAAACMGKTPYLSKSEALEVISRREKAGRVKQRGRGRMHTYHCDQCYHWHIGSSSQ